MTTYGERLDAVERVRLANLPTPVADAPRLAEHAGLSRLMIKRDDMTGLAFGGNKARKLEYDLADVARQACDVLVTIGGTQSNHVVMTAAAVRRLGLEVVMSADDLECYDAYVGEYGVPTPAGQDAMRTAARLEGLVLDPVYTGKSISGLLDLAHRRVLDPAVPTVFLHTGGLPIVFAFENAIREQAVCTKIRR